MNENKKASETVYINGSRVFVDNGEVKTIFNEEIQRTGYMSVDEMYSLVDANVRKIYEMNDGLSS